MENKKLWLGMLVLVFGITVVGTLEAQTDSLNGTWVTKIGALETETILNNGSYETSAVTQFGIVLTRGTYTTNGNILTMTPSHIHGGIFATIGAPRIESRWYSRNEFRTVVGREVTDAQFNEAFGLYFMQTTFTYSVKGNTLSLMITQEYTRR